MMDLESLELLIALAESGSFSKAAERRAMSQSAVSQRLRALESALGHILVVRGKGRPGAELTEAGARVLAAAREIAARRTALERELAELGGEPGGTLNVATVYSIGLHALTPALQRFLAACPQVNLHLEYLRTDRIYAALLEGTLDCGIVACPQKRAGIEVVSLTDEPMVAISAPGHVLSGRDPLAPEELRSASFVAFDADIPTRRRIDGWLGETAVRVVQAFDNIETIKRVVEIGLGVAIVPEPTVRREVRDGALVVRKLEPALSRPTGILLRQGGARSRALARFLDVLLAETKRPDEVRPA